MREASNRRTVTDTDSHASFFYSALIRGSMGHIKLHLSMEKKFFLAVLILAASTTVFAQQHEGNNVVLPNDSNKTEIPETVQMLQVAGQLVKYGYEQEAALPLIQAIEIYQNNAGAPSRSGEKTAENNGSASSDASKSSAISYNLDNLIADATTFADGDEHYLALIDNLKNSKTRGATKNYATHYDCVSGNSTDSYTIRFRGNEIACVVVSGDGDTDLDLYVYDQNGNLITKDIDYSDDCVVTWTPAWTGSFTIKIKNRGRISNCYTMAVN